MKDIFGMDVEKDDFLPPLSEEAAAEVRRLIGGYPQYHSSVAAEMDEEEMEETSEQRNLHLYGRRNTRLHVTAQQAEYERFKRLPKKQRDAEIAKDLERIGQRLKENEEFMKTWKKPTDDNDSESEADEEVDDDEEEEEEEEAKDSDEDEGSVDEPGTKAWLKDWWKQMDSAWEEVYAHKISDPKYKRARAYSENSTYEKSEEAKKKRQTEMKKNKRGRKKKVVEEEEREEEEVEEEELGIIVEEIVYDEEDVFNKGGEKDSDLAKFQMPKMEEREERFGNEPVDIEWQEEFTDTPLSQKVPTFVVAEEKPFKINIASQEQPGILKLSQPTENVLAPSFRKITKSVKWDDEYFYPVEENHVVEEQVVAEKPAQIVENQLVENPVKMDLASTPPDSRPPTLQSLQSGESSDYNITIEDPNNVTMEENEMRFHDFFNSDFNVFTKEDVVTAPEVNRDVTGTVTEEDEMNFNAFFNSEGDSDGTNTKTLAKEKDIVIKESSPPVTQIATETVDKEPKSLEADQSLEKEQKKETTVNQDLPPPVTQIATDTVMEEAKRLETEKTPSDAKELEKHVDKRMESDDLDSSLPETLPTVSPLLPPSPSRVLRSKSKGPGRPPHKRNVTPDTAEIAPKLAKRKLPTRQDPPATVTQEGRTLRSRRTLAPPTPSRTTASPYLTRSQKKKKN
ncbi:unnamed protein product [Caenorhabditis brenneri]